MRKKNLVFPGLFTRKEKFGRTGPFARFFIKFEEQLKSLESDTKHLKCQIQEQYIDFLKRLIPTELFFWKAPSSSFLCRT